MSETRHMTMKTVRYRAVSLLFSTLLMAKYGSNWMATALSCFFQWYDPSRMPVTVSCQASLTSLPCSLMWFFPWIYEKNKKQRWPENKTSSSGRLPCPPISVAIKGWTSALSLGKKMRLQKILNSKGLSEPRSNPELRFLAQSRASLIFVTLPAKPYITIQTTAVLKLGERENNSRVVIKMV